MPCLDGGPSPAELSYESKARADKLAQLLCEACSHLEKAFLMEIVSGELLEWWSEHKEQDIVREKQQIEKEEKERIKRSALNKLTAEELKALGLNK